MCWGSFEAMCYEFHIGSLTYKANFVSTKIPNDSFNLMGYSNANCGLFNAGGMNNGYVKQANYMENQFQGRQANNSYSYTYSPGWQNHLNVL